LAVILFGMVGCNLAARSYDTCNDLPDIEGARVEGWGRSCTYWNDRGHAAASVERMSSPRWGTYYQVRIYDGGVQWEWVGGSRFKDLDKAAQYLEEEIR
jgi:hypothetical protein